MWEYFDIVYLTRCVSVSAPVLATNFIFGYLVFGHLVFSVCPVEKKHTYSLCISIYNKHNWNANVVNGNEVDAREFFFRFCFLCCSVEKNGRFFRENWTKNATARIIINANADKTLRRLIKQNVFSHENLVFGKIVQRTTQHSSIRIHIQNMDIYTLGIFV